MTLYNSQSEEGINNKFLGGGFKHFLFSSLLGKMIQFDCSNEQFVFQFLFLGSNS